MWFQSQIHSIQLVCQLTVRRHPIIQITQMMMIQFCGCLFFRDPHRWRWSNDHSFQYSSIVIPAPRIVQNKETEFSRKSAVRGETRKEISKKDWLPKLTRLIVSYWRTHTIPYKQQSWSRGIFAWRQPSVLRLYSQQHRIFLQIRSRYWRRYPIAFPQR